MSPFLRRARHSRLLHFLVLGGVLFAASRGGDRRRIDLATSNLSAMRAAEATRIAPAPLDAPRAREIEARAIEDEILYREALRMSLDKEDPLVRQRLVQKLLLLVEDLGGASRAPSDEELQRYFEETRDRWRSPARLHFVHVFAATKEALPPREVLAPSASAAPPCGEAFPYSRDVIATRDEITRLYGDDVAQTLERQDGTWSDPVASTFGWHRTRVVERLVGAPATFASARKELELDFMIARRERIVGGYLRSLAASYDIRIDGRSFGPFTPTRRIAQRTDPSAED
jgi:parvulin-like peptidyl-prolyl cis-trans isomerase-like protein